MHVARTPSKYVDKAGDVHRYESVLVRRSYRDGKKVRHETLANLSKLPAEVIAAIEAALKGQALVPAEAACTITRSLPHGHVAAVAAMARRLGFPGLLGPACRSRDLVLGLIISRVIRPASKLSTLSRWADCTLGPDLAVADASSDEVYAAMDWLADRQEAIEKKLAAKHLGPAANPTRMAMFDLTSSWVTGRCCELAAYGYSRDGKKGCAQIEYGVLTDPAGRPVAVRVVPGNTADPVAFCDIVEVIRDRFGLTRLVLVGDRGMITSARITALRELNSDNATAFGWISALRAPDIATLAAEQGPLQMSLFDTHDLAEISHPDYPGERLIACRNPALAAERARKRNELLAATDADLAAVAARVAAGRLRGAGKIGEAIGRVIAKRKVGKHFHREITDTTFTYHRDQAGIDAEASLDGIYVLRTSVPATDLDPAAVVESYKNLAHVERDFRSIKTDDLDLRPIHHRLDERVRAHVLICLLACYLVWHLRQAWAPLTFTDEHPPARDNPVAPAQRSPQAQAKASTQHDANGNPLRSFRGLLDHLATLTRNDIHYHGTNATVPTLTQPTPDQRRAFDLIGTPIPLTAA
jgi:Transposase DDE domain